MKHTNTPGNNRTSHNRRITHGPVPVPQPSRDVVLTLADFGTAGSLNSMLSAVSTQIQGLSQEGRVTVVLNGDTYYPGFSTHRNNVLMRDNGRELKAHYRTIFQTLLSAGASNIVMNLGNHELGLGADNFGQCKKRVCCFTGKPDYHPIKGADDYQTVRRRVVGFIKEVIAEPRPSSSFSTAFNEGEKVQHDKKTAECDLEIPRSPSRGLITFGDPEDTYQADSTFSIGTSGIQAFSFDSSDCYQLGQFDRLCSYLDRCRENQQEPLIFSHHPGPTRCSQNEKNGLKIEKKYDRAGIYAGALWNHFENRVTDDWSGKKMGHNMHTARVIARAVREAYEDHPAPKINLIAGHIHGRSEEKYRFYLNTRTDQSVQFHQYIEGTGGDKDQRCGKKTRGFGEIIIRPTGNSGTYTVEHTTTSNTPGDVEDIENFYVTSSHAPTLPPSITKKEYAFSSIAGLIAMTGIELACKLGHACASSLLSSHDANHTMIPTNYSNATSPITEESIVNQGAAILSGLLVLGAGLMVAKCCHQRKPEFAAVKQRKDYWPVAERIQGIPTEDDSKTNDLNEHLLSGHSRGYTLSPT